MTLLTEQPVPRGCVLHRAGVANETTDTADVDPVRPR